MVRRKVHQMERRKAHRKDDLMAHQMVRRKEHQRVDPKAHQMVNMMVRRMVHGKDHPMERRKAHRKVDPKAHQMVHRKEHQRVQQTVSLTEQLMAALRVDPTALRLVPTLARESGSLKVLALELLWEAR